MKLKIMSLACLFIFSVLCVVGYFVSDYGRDFALMLAGSFFSLGIGVFVANIYLSHDERAKAARPLLAMIAPSIARFHNEFCIRPGRLAFGTPGFNAALKTYEDNGGKPESLSPEQRDKLYEVIKGDKDAMLDLLEKILASLVELSSILGWSFSPSVMRIVLDARISLTTFKSHSFGDSIDDKLRACELFIDLDSVLSALVLELNQILGRRDKDFLSAE
jgi:hypothetical protein